MIPVVKGWSHRDRATRSPTLGVQVHGGMGFIEETGAAQHLRDARITTIYEGTTGIQANDLIGRKIAREGGAMAAVVAEMRGRGELATQGRSGLGDRAAPGRGMKAVEECVDFIVLTYGSDPSAAHAGSVPFLKHEDGRRRLANGRAALIARTNWRRPGRDVVLPGQDRHGAFLRRPRAVAGGRVRAHHRRRWRIRTGARRERLLIAGPSMSAPAVAK